LRYDLRKLKGHGLLERDGARYAYRLTSKGVQVTLLFLFFHKRLCGPLANSASTIGQTRNTDPTAASKLPITAPAKPSKMSSKCPPQLNGATHNLEVVLSKIWQIRI
jgi:hypothetical protein